MSADPSGDTGSSQTEEIAAQLFGPLAKRIRALNRPRLYLYFLFALIFLRLQEPSAWAQVRDDVRQAVDEQQEPRRLLRRIGVRVAAALRKRGVPQDALLPLGDLDPETVDDVHYAVRLCEGLGTDAFHSLTDHFQSWSKPKDGTYFTPRSLVKVMTNLLLTDAEASARAHDPVLGSGELLADVWENSPGVRLTGTSPSRELLALAVIRLHALNVPGTDLNIDARPHRSEPLAGSADLIVANTPFSSSRSAGDEDPGGSWRYGPPPQHSDTYAWLQHVLVSLTASGRAVVLMPNRAAVSTDARELHIRQGMIKDGTVECLIALPRDLFAGTPAPAMIWILRSPSRPSAGRAERVLLINARGYGTKSGRRRIFARDETEALTECVRRWRSGDPGFSEVMGDRGTAVAVPVTEITKNAYSLDPSGYLPESLAFSGRGFAVEVPRPADALAARLRDIRLADERVSHITVEEVTSDGHGAATGWQDKHLGDVCQIQAGPSHSLLKEAERTADGVPLVVPAHLRDHRISAGKPDRLSPKSQCAAEKYRIREGDVLMARTGTVGPTALVTEAKAGWVLATNLMRLRPAAGVDSRYLLAFLSSPAAQTWIKARGETATAIPSISAGTLKTLPVKLPPPDEQYRIGQAVDALDAQINAHTALADTARITRAALAGALLTGRLNIDHLRKDEA